MEKAGDDRAARFRVLVLPELAYLHRMARVLVSNRQGAEDLVQDSVLRGLQYFESYRGDSFRGWMAAIMRNVHRDRDLHAASSTAPDDEWINQIPDTALNPEQKVLEADRAAQMREAISKLPDRFREVLVLREFGGLSYAQIAATLSVPTGTVMSRLARARDDLRKAWLVSDDEVAQ
jgi:RNA polymerase sigma factor (sigma-70 family)